MYELKKMERYLRVNLLGPGPRLMKKEFTGRGLTKVHKNWPTQPNTFSYAISFKLKLIITGWQGRDGSENRPYPVTLLPIDSGYFRV